MATEPGELALLALELGADAADQPIEMVLYAGILGPVHDASPGPPAHGITGECG